VGNREIGSAATRSIRLPRKLRELYTPIPYIIPAQLFAACLAAQKGIEFLGGGRSIELGLAAAEVFHIGALDQQ